MFRTLEPERFPALTRPFITRIYTWLKPHSARFAAVFGLVLLGAIFQIVQPLVLRSLVDSATSGADLTSLAQAAGVLIALPVLGVLVGVAQRRVTLSIGADFLYEMRVKVYTHLQHLPYRMYVHAPPGEVNARMSGDVQMTEQLLLTTLPDGFGHSLRLAGTITAMFFLEWRLTLAALAVLPFIAWIARRRNQQARQIAIKQMQVFSALGYQVGETTQPGSVQNIRLFDRVAHEIERYRGIAQEARGVEVSQSRFQAGGAVSSSVVVALGTAAVYAVGGLLVAANTFTIGTVVAFVAYLSGLYAALQGLVALPQGAAQSLLAFERIFELLDLENEPGDSQTSVALPNRARGSLEVQSVTFRYNDAIPFRDTARAWSRSAMGPAAAPDHDRQPEADALVNISFSVEPGQMLALVGPSGAGKSTLFQLIPRLYDVGSGAISLDGTDIRQLPLTWLRQQIGYVSQHVYVFPGTLGDNLRYAAPGASDKRVMEACELASLGDFIRSLPDGLDTYVGQSGARLSGGERQRLAIARVLLKDAPILLLDEATSHLDTLNESLIRTALERARQGRTTLVIAHRLSTIHSANQILVLERGRIVERGTHSQLLAQSGLYARLYEKQFLTSGETGDAA